MAAPSQTLPYFCSPEALPGPLPSLDEIESAHHTLPSNLGDDYLRIVVVRDNFVVKYGVEPCVSENEGQALLLLSKYPSIPVPRLYAMYRDGGRLFLVMEFMGGTPLSAVWDGLSEDDKLDVTGQLRDMFARVREIPSPGLFGSVVGGPLRHRFFLSASPDPAINGPFRDEKDFSAAMAIRSRRNWEQNGRRPWTSEFLERHLAAALAGHASVFTHGDIQRKNILVSRRAAPEGESEHQQSRWQVTAVVDWEDAGWYPSYWEYAGSFIYFVWEDDWPEKFERIIDPCPLEAGLLQFVRQDLDY